MIDGARAPRDDYRAFLEAKVTLDPPSGMAEAPLLPRALKPFQRDIVAWALRRGRAAIFAGTGLGKTLQQLVWAQEVHRHTGAPILILTPLAVAQQTVAEAAKFSVEGVAYAPNQAEISSPLTVTNYDRLDHFDLSAFVGVVLDESSIIKSDMVFVGVDDSFEQLFQAIRRCWRFGQTRPVNVYLVASELEGAVVENIAAKERDFERMCEEMARHMKDLTRTAVRGGRLATSEYRPAQPMRLPQWMVARRRVEGKLLPPSGGQSGTGRTNGIDADAP